MLVAAPVSSMNTSRAELDLALFGTPVGSLLGNVGLVLFLGPPDFF